MLKFLLEVFGLERRITIGLNRDSSPELRNGIAHVRPSSGGNVEVIPFVVNNPELLNKPSFFLIESLYEQLIKMGFEPLNLEIETPTQRRVYKYGKFSPVLVQQRFALA